MDYRLEMLSIPFGPRRYARACARASYVCRRRVVGPFMCSMPRGTHVMLRAQVESSAHRPSSQERCKGLNEGKEASTGFREAHRVYEGSIVSVCAAESLAPLESWRLMSVDVMWASGRSRQMRTSKVCFKRLARRCVSPNSSFHDSKCAIAAQSDSTHAFVHGTPSAKLAVVVLM